METQNRGYAVNQKFMPSISKNLAGQQYTRVQDTIVTFSLDMRD